MDNEPKLLREYESVRPAPKSDTEAKKIITEVQKKLSACIEAEDNERAKMLDDLRFCTLDQWPETIRNERENDAENGPRPCLTIDKINQYLVQVTNDIRQGRPGIVVRPQDDKADPETAKIIKGLIRNIEDQSSADIAYACATESAARIGMGFWRITTEYLSEESFDQDIFIRAIQNPFAVYLGPHSMPDGSDARYGFVLEAVPIEVFKQKHPKAKHDTDSFSEIDSDQLGHWRTDHTVTVAEFYSLVRTDAVLYFLADGTTIFKDEYDKWPIDRLGPAPEVTASRPTYRERLKWCKLTGTEILDERTLPGKYIPIVEVVGREAIVDGKRVLWGLVRPSKDSLRMYNYFASTVTEKMGLAPKAPFIGAKGQFRGQEDKWKKANRVNYAYLEYDPIEVNGNAVPAPQRQGATPMEAALLTQMDRIEHDVQTSLGIFKAGLGEHESQQSGRAILALQRESDTGTYHFGANLGLSIRHTGRVILDLIPHYYDTRRVVRILGDDGAVTTAEIDPEQSQARTSGPMGEIYNPTLGKYDISITVGPGYNTKRMEAAAVLTEMVKSQPDMIQLFGDIMFRSLDFPYADVIAERMKRMFPQMQGDGAEQQIPPQAQAQMQQMGEQLQAAQETMGNMDAEIKQLKAGEEIEARKLEAAREASQAEFVLQKEKQDAELTLQRDKAMAEIELKRAIALAELEIERMKIEENADVEVDMAIAKVKNMVAMHETKMQGEIAQDAAAREGAEGAPERSGAENMAAMQEMHKAFLEAVSQIVEGLRAKKHVEMTMPDGRSASATVTMQ